MSITQNKTRSKISIIRDWEEENYPEKSRIKDAQGRELVGKEKET